MLECNSNKESPTTSCNDMMGPPEHARKEGTDSPNVALPHAESKSNVIVGTNERGWFVASNSSNHAYEAAVTNFEDKLVYVTSPNGKKRLANNTANLTYIIRSHPDLARKLRFNSFSSQVEKSDSWPCLAGFEPAIHSAAFTDSDTVRLKAWISRKYGLEFGVNDILGAVKAVAETRAYNPVRDYLRSLTWDGVPRIDRIPELYLGGVAEPIASVYCAKWLVGCVARGTYPGCKMDTMLILEGGQGAMKSTFAGILGGRWFTDSEIAIEGKEGGISLQAYWIVEMGELKSLAGKSAETVKRWLTVRSDSYRAPYEKTTQDHPRHVVFIGSTNEASYLDDATGARRFWPVKVSKVDTHSLTADRDQLFAEALARLDAAVAAGQATVTADGSIDCDPGAFIWWLSPEETGLQREDAESRQHEDPWQDIIGAFASTRSEIKVRDILVGPLDLDPVNQDKRAQMRVAAILRKLGWVRKVKEVDKVPTKVWVKGDESK